MTKQNESVAMKTLRKNLTMEFVQAVTFGGKDIIDPNQIEKDLEIGKSREDDNFYGVGGKSWSRYQFGTRSMSFKSLCDKIEMANSKGYISPEEAKRLLSKVPRQKSDHLSVNFYPSTRGEYVFDVTELFSTDISVTSQLLIKQVQQLRNKISYGHQEIDNLHYYTTVMTNLKEVNDLIQAISSKKEAEEARISKKFRCKNYREIKPEKLPIPNYCNNWWVRSEPKPL